jgi:uncharacterized protein YjiS (DUF1127 family)
MNASNPIVGVRPGAGTPSPAGLVRRAARALHTALHRTAEAHRRRRLGRATVLTLQSLDAHTLRDLGFDRSEIPPAVAEWLGEVDVARARFVQSV